MTLVAVPAPTAAPAPVADQVAGDGWWPGLSLKAFRAAQRIGTQVDDGRVRNALVDAMIAVGGQLEAWRAARAADGAEQLEDVAGPEFGGEKRPIVLWRTAVHATAAADLAETHVEISATGDGRDVRDQRSSAAPELQRAATVAIRQLLGRKPSRVMLL